MVVILGIFDFDLVLHCYKTRSVANKITFCTWFTFFVLLFHFFIYLIIYLSSFPHGVVRL